MTDQATQDVTPAQSEGEEAVEPFDEEEWRRKYDQWFEGKKSQGKKIRSEAQASYKAMELWPIYAETEEKWAETCEEAGEQYHSGYFFIKQLGAEHYLDPHLTATIWTLRNNLVAEYGMQSAAEEMLIDMMLLGYYNALRVQGWVGNLASQIEREFFDEHGLHEIYDEKNHGHTSKGLWVQGMLERYREQLLPLLDRCDRMMIRNLRAIQDLRRSPTPTVAIGRAEQVNVAGQQVNQVG